MASSTFVLKEPKSTEPTLVYLIFRFNNTRFKYSTSQKIHPKFWNAESQTARATIQFTEHVEFNPLLKNLDTIVHNTYRKLLNDSIVPTPEHLRIPLDEFLQKRNGASKDLISFAENLIETTDRKASTKKQLKHTVKKLKDFKLATNRSLHLDSIDLDFYDQIVDYLIKKNYGKNTIGTMIKNIKVFMNEAVDRKLTSNLQFKNKRFKALEEDSESIYLSENEIKKIYEHDFKDNLRLEKVRDLFIIACCTGLRFSDLVILKNENIIQNGRILRIKTQKTDEVVIIPLKSYVRKILKKYKGTPPEGISNQKMNDYLKEIGELVKINEDFVKTITKGGIRTSTNSKKWQMITTHTARRSFATNAYLQSVPAISIMKITGHRTEKSFLRYIKISQEDNANKLINHPFFK